MSKYAKVGADVSAFLACANASSCGCAHKKLVSSTEERPQWCQYFCYVFGTGCKLIDEAKKGALVGSTAGGWELCDGVTNVVAYRVSMRCQLQSAHSIGKTGISHD